MMRLALIGMGLTICLTWLLYIVASINASTTHRRTNEAFNALPLWGKLLFVAVMLGIGLIVVSLRGGPAGCRPQRLY